MRGRLTVLVATLLLFAVPASAYGAKPAEIVVQGVDTSAYPRVTLHLMLPSGVPEGAARFTAQENGERVPVTAKASSGRDPLAVVLVMDVSGSMKGEPLDAAKRAAASFIAKLEPTDQVAVVSFAEQTNVISQFGTDRAATRSAIDGMQAYGETALYDALAKADDIAEGAATSQRSIVLLSDGGDTVSKSSLEGALQRARTAQIPVFALGLRSPEAAPAVLAQVAQQTHGRALTVDKASDLSSVYVDVAAQIRNRFDVVVTSARPMTKDLEIAVDCAAGSSRSKAMVAIANPALVGSVRISNVALPLPFGTGLLGILAISGLAFGAVALTAAVALPSLMKDRSAIEQLAYYDQGIGSDTPGSLRERVTAVIGHVADKRGLTAELQRRLELAAVPLRPAEYILAHLVVVVALAALMQFLLSSIALTVCVVLFAAFAPLLLLDILATRRKAAFAAQLPDVFSLIAGSLRSGFGMGQAVEQIAQEFAAPASAEFQRVMTEVRLGLPVESALDKMAERMDSDDFRWAVSAISIQREVGGNLAAMLDIVSHTIRERDSVRRQIKALTSEGKLSAVILVVLPFVLAGVLFFASPGYLALLFTNAVGLLMLLLAGSLMVSGILWIRAVSSIEV